LEKLTIGLAKVEGLLLNDFKETVWLSPYFISSDNSGLVIF